MNKLIIASLVLFGFFGVMPKVSASTLHCKFKQGGAVTGVKSIQISENSLILNKEMEIPLEKSRVKCGNFGRQTRFDGMALGYQVVLKTCTTEAELEGILVDNIHQVAADVLCNSKE